MTYPGQISFTVSRQPVRSTGELVDVTGMQADSEGLYTVGHILYSTLRIRLVGIPVGEAVAMAEKGTIEAMVETGDDGKGRSLKILPPGGAAWLLRIVAFDLSANDQGTAADVTLESELSHYEVLPKAETEVAQ